MSHMRYDYQFTMSSVANNDEVRILLARLCDELAYYGVSSDTRSSAQLVLAEALNNITKHAYGGRGEGTVQVQTEVGSEMLRFTLNDTGEAIPGPRLPRGRPQDTDVPLEDLPEGGFGWFMIRSLAKDLSYARRGDWNELCFRIDPPA